MKKYAKDQKKIDKRREINMNNQEINDFDKYPRKCIACGLGDIKMFHNVCRVCGWEDDG